MKKSPIICADLFCGAGGYSSGLMEAAREMGIDVRLMAVNHWQIAIDSHSSNHPGAKHLCQSIADVDPRKEVPDGYLNILLASPECKWHSNARGGKPINDQLRATAWQILRWAEALYIETILIENVPEFRDWGPLDAAGRPIKSKKGQIFRRYLSALRALDYTVDWRILNAADYGDATTRRRLFIQCRRGRKRPVWPAPTHLPANTLLSDPAKPWRTAREIIDWSLPGESIFDRKRPLAPKTMKRIMAGLEKYSGLSFIVPNFGEREGQSPRTHSVEDPLPTVTGHGAGALVQPYVIALEHHGSDDKHRIFPMDKPMPTITAKGQFGLCEPFIVVLRNNCAARSVDEPLPTLCAGGKHVGIAEPFLLTIDQQGSKGSCGHSVHEPIPTITTKSRVAICEPFLVSYYGNGNAYSVDEPLDTVTGRDRFGLVRPMLVSKEGEPVGMLDIRFRMLQPHELKAAMGFSKDYKLVGSKADQVMQIGNAVPVTLAKALCKSVLTGRSAA